MKVSLPLALSVQFFYWGLDDFLLQRGVLFYHPPGSVQILGKVFPGHRFLHLLESGQHLGGVTGELLERNADLSGSTAVNMEGRERVTSSSDSDLVYLTSCRF